MKLSGRVLTVILGMLMICTMAAGSATGATSVATAAEAGTAATGPANPNANQATKNILSYMRDVSFSEKTVMGAFNWPDNNGYGNKSPDAFREHDQYIEEKYNFSVGILALHFPLENNTSLTYEYDYTLDQAEKAYKEGRILMMHFSNQWEYLFVEKYSETYLADAELFIRNFDSSYADRNMDLYNNYMAIVKQWGDGLEKLQDRGISVMLRAFGEMNNHPCFLAYSDEGKQHFKNIWRQMFDYLVSERKLNNVLFGFTPVVPGNKNHRVDKDGFDYYPGDDVVDYLCPTMYPNGGNGLEEYWQWGWDYSNYIATGKPFGISELGLPSNADHITSLPSASMRANYGRFMSEMKQKMPRASFVVLWTDSILYPSATNVEPFLYDSRVLSLDDVPDLTGGVYPSVGDIMTYSKVNFAGDGRQTLSDGRYSLAQLKQAGFDPAKVASLRMAGDRAITFYKEDGCKGEGWMFVGDVSSLSSYGFDGGKVKSVEIKALDRQQVSIGKPAQASEAAEDASLANDGKWTSWDTSNGIGSWLSIDLQGVYLLNRWKVEHGGVIDRGVATNTYNYRLQYSMDGKSWKDADVVMGNWYDSTTRDIAQIKAQYIRLYIDKPNNETEQLYQSYACIVDWGVYGVQAAQKLANTDPPPATAGTNSTTRSQTDDTSPEPGPTETETETTDTTEDEPEETDATTSTAATQGTSSTAPDKQTDAPEGSFLPWIITGIAVLAVAGIVVAVVLLRKKKIKD